MDKRTQEQIRNVLRTFKGYSFNTKQFITQFKKEYPRQFNKFVKTYGKGGKGNGSYYSTYTYLGHSLKRYTLTDNLCFLSFKKSPITWGSPVIAYWAYNPLGGQITEYPEEMVDVSKLTLKQLKKKIVINKNLTKNRTISVKISVRDPYVSEFVKRIAGGHCLLCKREGPFKDKTQQLFLESHHIVWLSRGGEDNIKNTVALCPNCHRKMHIVDNEKDVKILIMRAAGLAKKALL